MAEEVVGKWIKLWRPAGKKTGPVFAEILHDLYLALKVAPYDPRPRLLEMWGLVKPGDQVGDDQVGDDDAPKGGPEL